MEQYVDARDFKDFKVNQDKLINILNHNMTIMGVDVKWLKQLNRWQLGISAAILVTLLTMACKVVMGL